MKHPGTPNLYDASLPVGEGGCGLGMSRDTGSGEQAIHARVPRNAPPVFNLGAREVRVMFHDGRLEAGRLILVDLEVRVMFHDGRLEVDENEPSGFDSPAGDALPEELDNVGAAQALFPVTSLEEMAGQPGENPVADAAAEGPPVALVTGGGTGIGAACCRALAAEGFRIAVHYRSSAEEKEARELAAEAIFDKKRRRET